MPTTIINASAGSGKTYRLAVAYLQALLQPLADGSPTSPQSVLATTFTRAAASEILERVLRRLALAAISETESQRLLLEIERPDLQRADLQRLLESVCKVLPQLQVGTIDGLFARIARVMGLDLAFPPAWTMANDSLADELALEAADQILSGAEVQLARAQWRRYAQFKPGLRIRTALVELLEENRFVLLDAILADDDPDLAEPLLLAREEAEQFLQALAAFEIPLTKTRPPRPHQLWKNSLEKMKTLFAGDQTLISIFRGHNLMRVVHLEEGTYLRGPVPASLRELLAPLAARGREEIRRLHEARLPALAALSRRYHDVRSSVAHARGAYRFPEIEAAARLLPSHLSPEDLYFRLDGQIQHLLLDEFQDTSLSQFRFLWPIITDVRANGRLFFAVGDVKQSIYGWRGADRRLLERLPEWLSPGGADPDLRSENLPDNRRSSPAVLRAVDLLFQNLGDASSLDPALYSARKKLQARARKSAAFRFTHGYQPHRPVGDNRYLPGRVRLLLTTPPDADQEPDEDEIPDEIETILQAVELHRSEDPNREIAILCRRHKLMAAILAGLRMRRIVASGEGGNPVTDSAAVEVVLSMLTWLDHPGHTLAREHVKLSGVEKAFGFDAAISLDSIANRSRAAILRRGLAAVVSEWVRDENFRRRATIHDQVRTEQLIELARHWDAAGGGRLSRFVNQVRSQRVDNPASSRVRVMTIHGSKGLEFEAVILADIEARGGGADGPRLAVLMTSPDAPPSVTLLPNADDAEILGMEEDDENYQRDKFEEDLSVLYVALTRAKSFLDVVLLTETTRGPTLSALIRERWGQDAPGIHLVDQCPATVKEEIPVSPVVMGRDPGIWETGDGLTLPVFSPVPRRLDTITPSGQEGAGIVKLSLVLNTGNAAALEKGTAVHALLSRLKWLDSLPSERSWTNAIPRDEARLPACRTAARELHPRLLNRKDTLARVFDAASWQDCWKNDGVRHLEVWRERRFAVIIGRELLSGSFDRVVLGLDEAGVRVRAAILDFKTDRLDNNSEREERAAHYQPQLDAYKTALQKLTGIPAPSIQTELVWIYWSTVVS